MAQGPELPPPVAVLQMITGRWISHMVGVAAELGLADQVQRGPQTAAELAHEKGLNAGALLRLLRGLAGMGVFAEQADGRFAQTPLSDALRSDVPYSIRGMARMVNRPWNIGAWMELEHALRSGESAFEHVNGMQAFDYMLGQPKEMEIFAAAMSSFSAQVGAAVAEAYDFSQLGTLADIGGSHGMLLCILLAKFPQLRGVLFDLPQVVAGARPLLEQHGAAQRVELVGGNFFESVPSGADAYLFKYILHDWSDADSVRILKTVHAAAKPDAKLLLVEAVLQEGNAPQFAKLLDLEMLVITHGGRERNLHEWKQLLEQSGFRFSRVVPTAAPASIIEAIKS